MFFGWKTNFLSSTDGWATLEQRHFILGALTLPEFSGLIGATGPEAFEAGTPLFSPFSLLLMGLGLTAFFFLLNNTAHVFQRFIQGLRLTEAIGVRRAWSRRGSGRALKSITEAVPSRPSHEEPFRKKGSLQAELVRKRAAIDLLLKVSSAANAARSSSEIMRVALRLVCEYIHWPVGHVFLPDPEVANDLISARIWYLECPDKFEIFRRTREATRLYVGYGLSGEAWKTKGPIWFNDVSRRDCPRSPIASAAGIRAAAAVPVLVGEDPVAVLEFFSSEAREPDEDVLELLTQVGSQIGRVFERERAALALQESEDRFRALSNAGSEGIVIHTAGIVVEANAAAAALTGYEPQDMIGLSVENLLVPDTGEALQERARMAADRKWETALVRRDGRILKVEAEVKNITYRGVRARVIVFRDITEQKEAIEALQESEERFRHLSNAAFEGVAVLLDGILVEVNEGFVALFGYESPKELIGVNSLDLVAPEHHQLVEQVVRSGSERRYEVTGIRRDGSRRMLEVCGRNVRFQGRLGRVAALRDITERKKSEAALRDSEGRFRLLFHGNPQPMCVFDQRTFQFLEVNEAAIRLYGHSRDEFLSLKLSDIQPEENNLTTTVGPSSAWDTTDYTVEWTHLLKNGSKIFVESVAHPMEFGGRDSMLMVNHDITARRKWEQALRESEERFRRLSEAAFEAVLIHQDKKVVEVNQAFLNMFDYTNRSEILGKPVLDLVEEAYRELVETKIRNRDQRHYEMEMLRKDGKRIVVEVRARSIPYDGGTARVATLNDITRRKRTEEMLREREARLSVLIEQMPAVLWSTDKNLRFTSNSGAGFRPLGVKNEELVGTTLYEYFHTNDTKFTPIDAHLRAMRGESLSFEIVWGGRFFEAHVEPLRNDQGEVTGAIGVALDLTERKSSEQKLEVTAAELIRSNRELEQFAYVASHDLQEPLRMISSYMDLLSKRYCTMLDTDADEFIKFAVNGAKRMKQQIDDLLEYSRVNRRGTDFGRLETGIVVKNVLANLKLAIEESGAQIRVGSLPIVHGDAAQLGQVLQNLVINAIKFRKSETPIVEIDAESSGNEWILSVKDNGIGIEMEYADRIFLIFQRLHTVSEYPGTGIGLAICKKIIERHGGRIWVESQRGGRQYL